MTIAVERPSVEPVQSQPGPAPRERLIAGRFRLIEQLGRGGMGRVYRAHDEVLDRPVAVKLIYDDAVRDRDVKHACAVEARAAAGLNHPGIVRILDSGFDDGHCYVVMSLVEGRPLNEILREDGPLSVDRALDLAIQVADALAAAHADGVIHCDVKPGNLLVDGHWRARLVDFGIARVTSSTTGLTGELLQGSAQYVAPEQVEGASVDGRTDLYALGTVLYEMLTGRTPFGGGTIASVLARRLVNDPPPIREVDPAVPPQLDQVILKALARDPDERFQTAADFRDALITIRQSVPMFPVPARTQGQSAGRLRLPRPTFASPASARAGWERARGAIRRGSELATDWAARSGHWTRRVGATTLPGAMTHARLLTPAHRPTLRAGIGMAVVVGLLVGSAAAKCGVAGVSAEATVASEPTAITAERPAAATPTLILGPPEAAPLAESSAPVATEPPPTAVPPAATIPAQTTTPPPPAPAAPRPPVQALSAPPPQVPAAPAAAESAPQPPPPADKEDGEKRRNTLSNTPRSEEKTPEERAKADAKKNEDEKKKEEEKRAEPARPATLAPYVEPARQQAPPPKPQAPPPAAKPAQQRGGGDDRGPAPARGNAKEKEKQKEKD